MVDKNVVEDFLRAIQPQDTNTDHTYNATVTKVDRDGVVWVQVAGSDRETPTSSTSSEVKRGDAVNVQWRNNKLYVAGNYSNPSAGSIRVNAVEMAAQVANQAASNAVADAGIARQAAESVKGIAEQAQEDAGRAKDAADNASEYAARAFGNLSTVQSITETLTWITQHGTMTLTTDVTLDPTHVYFVQDAGGDYVVGGVTYAVVTEPDVADIATYYELSIDESLNNYVGTHLALTSDGLWLVPEAGGNKVLIATGGVGHTYEDAGTYIIDGSDNVLAQFLASGAQIGEARNGKKRIEITNNGLILYKRSSGNDTELAHLGDNYYTFGSRVQSEPVGFDSFATGQNTVASGDYSFSEGLYTEATNDVAHAGGNRSTANGYCSFAHGMMVEANYDYQTVIGKYNDNNSNNAFEIGNGNGNYSNALTVDWDGNVDAAGSIISDANYEDAWHDSTQGYTVSGVSLAGSTYLGQAIRLEKVSGTKKHPIFNGFDISGTGTARIHTLGHYIYKATYNGEQYWYAYIKMRNDNTSAINNFDVTAYIAWI